MVSLQTPDPPHQQPSFGWVEKGRVDNVPASRCAGTYLVIAGGVSGTRKNDDVARVDVHADLGGRFAQVLGGRVELADSQGLAHGLFAQADPVLGDLAEVYGFETLAGQGAGCAGLNEPD